jgi:hypothetical protein
MNAILLTRRISVKYTFRLLWIVVSCSVLSSVLSAGVVYTNNFESPVGAEWNTTSRVTTSNDLVTNILGEFTNFTATLTLSGLAVHTSVTVDFDFFALDSWDGNDTSFGPDFFAVMNGGTVLFETTITNFSCTNCQSFPGPFPSSNNGRTGATPGISNLGFNTGFPDGIYHMTQTFAHSTSTLTLGFRGRNLQSLGDEGWGLDNVSVSTETTTGVPEPGTLTLLIGGGALLLALGRRRL